MGSGQGGGPEMQSRDWCFASLSLPFCVSAGPGRSGSIPSFPEAGTGLCVFIFYFFAPPTRAGPAPTEEPRAPVPCGSRARSSVGRGRQARLWPGEAPQVPSEDLASVLQNAFACPGGQQRGGGGKEGRGFWASLFQCLPAPPSPRVVFVVLLPSSICCYFCASSPASHLCLL